MKYFVYFFAVMMGFALVASADAEDNQAQKVVEAFGKVMVKAFETHHDACVEYMFTNPIAPTAELMMSEYSRCMGEHYLVLETFLVSKHDEKYKGL